ncbi:MAG: hypothetical protein HY743_00735 [Deltaproteobacteria bacterium]|nr:hypothetical protein [Deltaproteobacteria bacterium]
MTRTWAEARRIISGEAKLGDFTEGPRQGYDSGGNGAAAPTARSKETASWPVMAQEAFYGLAGEFVGLVTPHTESDPVALNRIRQPDRQGRLRQSRSRQALLQPLRRRGGGDVQGAEGNKLGAGQGSSHRD